MLNTKGNTDLLSENISDKKVLVLGSGPSATEINWESKEWDVLITTSFFYLNCRFRKPQTNKIFRF